MPNLLEAPRNRATLPSSESNKAAIMMNQLGLLIITTVIDLIICVTMYRILADVFAGDKNILGLSKVL